MESLAGRRIGPYLIESIIGRGGMGDVYLARHERLERDCALKVLRPELASRSELRERFVREARAAARLEHPNIVTVYDAGEEDGLAYFAMQYVEGSTLAALIRSGGCSRSTAVSILRDVAAALDVAHRGGMVHRDVKPANIIITPDGQPMLTDFGIVHLRPEAQLTATGELIGTPAYMAPEQLTGASVTPQTDIYQLGVITYELLSGELPFQATEPAALLVAHLQETPTPIHEHVEELPPGVTSVLNRALHKLPDARFQTATAFVDELAAAMSGETTVASEPVPIDSDVVRSASATTRPEAAPPRRDWTWARRPVIVGAGFAAVVAAVLAVVALNWGGLPFGRDNDDGETGGGASSTVTGSFLESQPGENSEPAPQRGEVLVAYSVDELWPSETEGVVEFEDDGSPHMRLVAPDVVVMKHTLGTLLSDGSAFAEFSMLAVPDSYVEQCLISRVDPASFRGYVLCLNSSAETFAYYVERDGEDEKRVELLDPVVRAGTRQPNDWNELEIISRDDKLWFVINNQLLGAVTHDGPRSGEIGVIVYREGEEPVEIGWGAVAVLAIEPD